MQTRVNDRLCFENFKNVVPQILMNYPDFLGICVIFVVSLKGDPHVRTNQEI